MLFATLLEVIFIQNDFAHVIYGYVASTNHTMKLIYTLKLFNTSVQSQTLFPLRNV